MQEFENSLPLETRLDKRYCIKSILGEGGFGITYKAHDEKLDRDVAIKEYLPGECAARTSDSVTVQPRTNRVNDYQYGLSQFLEEARVLARFQHSNIVRVTNFIEQNGTAYLVMEFAEGITLNEWLKKKTDIIDEKTILGIITPLLKGLVEVHNSGLMHRDIKPGNIFLRKTGEPLLIDFGAARQALGEHSKSISAIVSMGYAPPEQYTTRGKQGPYTDLYAVGAVMYKLITGDTPIESPDRSHARAESENDPLISIKKAGKGKVSDWLLGITDQLLKISPKQRPQSAKAVIDAINNKTEVKISSEAATRANVTSNDNKTRIIKSSERFNKSPKARLSKKPGWLSKKPGWLSKKPGWQLSQSKIKLIMASVIVTSVVAGGSWWYSNSPETEQNVQIKKPVKYDATLYVDSTPTGATVFLNNKEIGVTPYKGNNLPNGERQLKLTHKDFKDEISDIILQSETTLKKSYQLIPTTDSLHQQHIDHARQQIKQQQYAAASQSLIKAEAAKENDPLNDEIRLLLKKGQIEQLLTQADQALEKGRFTSPSLDNSYYYFNQINELDPGNSKAKQGIKKIESRLLSLAETKIQNKKYNQASNYLSQVDSINPESKQAAKLRQKITAQTDAASNIKKLLAKAQQQFKNRFYTSPKNNNAYDTYRQVLVIDANNKTARTRISEIKNFYRKQFNKHIAANQISNAERDLRNLEKTAPGKQVIRQMEKTLQDKKKTLQKPKKSDMELVNNLIGAFKKHIESRDMTKIKKISHFIPGRQQFVEQLTGQYKSISVNISNFQFIAQKHQATANVELNNLIDKNGRKVIPGSWSKFTIKISKNNRQQYKVYW
jgi:serine/threonine protein kinase